MDTPGAGTPGVDTLGAGTPGVDTLGAGMLLGNLEADTGGGIPACGLPGGIAPAVQQRCMRGS